MLIFLFAFHFVLANSILKEADRIYAQRSRETESKHAIEMYRELSEKNPKDPILLWRLSMAYYFYGETHAKDSELKKFYFGQGIEVAEKSIALKEDCGECHFWYAINKALYGQEVGAFRSYFSLSDIEKHIKRSIEIDSKYAGAAGYRLLGQIEEALPGILGGSNDEALAYYKKAIETDPREPMNYLYAAKLLAEINSDDHKSVMEMIETGLKVPKPPVDHFESIKALEDLQKYKLKLTSN